MTRFSPTIVTMWALIASSLAGSVSASAQEARLLTIARESAIIAGGGKFCNFDPDEVEEFIAKSEARLSLLAGDEYEKILARLEFKNILDAYSVREPENGCIMFRTVFDQSRKVVQ